MAHAVTAATVRGALAAAPLSGRVGGFARLATTVPTQSGLVNLRRHRTNATSTSAAAEPSAGASGEDTPPPRLGFIGAGAMVGLYTLNAVDHIA
jgi:hypothetical protein